LIIFATDIKKQFQTLIALVFDWVAFQNETPD